MSDEQAEPEAVKPEEGQPALKPIGIPRWFPFLPVSLELVLRPIFVLAIIVIVVMLAISLFKGDGKDGKKIDTPPAAEQSESIPEEK